MGWVGFWTTSSSSKCFRNGVGAWGSGRPQAQVNVLGLGWMGFWSPSSSSKCGWGSGRRQVQVDVSGAQVHDLNMETTSSSCKCFRHGESGLGRPQFQVDRNSGKCFRHVGGVGTTSSFRKYISLGWLQALVSVWVGGGGSWMTSGSYVCR